MEISEITGMAASQVALHPLFEMNEDDELTMRSELCDQKKLKEYGQYEAYQKLMESFKARDQPCGNMRSKSWLREFAIS